MVLNWGGLEQKKRPKGGWEGEHANGIPKVVGRANGNTEIESDGMRSTGNRKTKAAAVMAMSGGGKKEVSEGREEKERERKKSMVLKVL